MKRNTKVAPIDIENDFTEEERKMFMPTVVGKGRSTKRIIAMTTTEKSKLVNDYLKGMSLVDIYRKYNINKHGAYRILDSMQIPRRGGSKVDKQLESTLDLFSDFKEQVLADARIEDGVLHIDVTLPTKSDVKSVVVNYKGE